jgi:hypothetical protein
MLCLENPTSTPTFWKWLKLLKIRACFRKWWSLILSSSTRTIQISSELEWIREATNWQMHLTLTPKRRNVSQAPRIWKTATSVLNTCEPFLWIPQHPTSSSSMTSTEIKLSLHHLNFTKKTNPSAWSKRIKRKNSSTK